jgi:hypothetical protein
LPYATFNAQGNVAAIEKPQYVYRTPNCHTSINATSWSSVKPLISIWPCCAPFNADPRSCTHPPC